MSSKIIIIILIVFCNIFLTTSCRKMYFFENDKFLSWYAANSNCKARGMNLVSIATIKELDYLKQYIKLNYGHILPYWLGAYRVNGHFVWTATGKKLKHFFWHMGEPNDKSSNENCIHTWEEYFDWNDNDCERELPFICELKVC